MKKDTFVLALLAVEFLQSDSQCVVQQSESLVLDTGEKERKFMTTKINYTDGPIGDIKVLNDFLPSPKDLAFKEEQIKVTIGLSKSSVDFFKKQAKSHHTQYQKMIRNLLDIYVTQHQ